MYLLVMFVALFPDVDSCNADIACSLSANGSTIAVSIHNATEETCVKGYMIELSKEIKNVGVEESLAVFSMDNIRGSPQLSQAVHTLGSAQQINEDGPCFFSITSKLFSVEKFIVFTPLFF